ncbi:site-specific integrase [Streptomyces sp. NBC_00162]|uniref:site-specific integrase n=1 Tax=Streptomyces sp. NBC_00162 TaxID=2903629 RepID=UPI00214C53AA|nr:site-specific integrase [Streptomyces sp. NBC_00162]UUU38011.1 site-specific integrase [Streptomyces sp. NBC_00162]
MTSLAAEHDPYILTMPGPDCLVVLTQWISPGNTHYNARYGESVWPLAPLIDNPSTTLFSIFWRKCPAPLLGEVKLVTWTMLNGRLRPTYLQGRGVQARSRTSASDMRDTCNEWMRLARWLHERRFTSLGACTEEVWRAYVSERWQEGVSRDYAEKICTFLSDLWAFDQLSARPANVTRPPWEDEGVDDFLPAADGSASRENSREPLDPQTLGPLLIWAIRFIDDFADDILAAWAERRRLVAVATANESVPEGLVALADYLLPLVQAGDVLPAVRMHGKMSLARTYVAALTGASLGQVGRFSGLHRLSDLADERPGPCPLQVPVTGRINGKPWRTHMDFDEAPELMRHLGTAAMIICLYLTGMRLQEVQGLRSGCCPEPEAGTDGAHGRYLIRSRHYKNVTDSDGNLISAGEERQVPWVAISPVVHAIRVLERMVPPGELLLSAARHDFMQQRGHHGALKHQGLHTRIEDFVSWANREANLQDLPTQIICADPHGAIGLARFRRTLAWHIARRPGGLIALAIQYGHMRTVLDARTSSGYGSRSRGGMHSVLDVETALAAADTAAHLRDRMSAGEKISGPAARRAVTAAATTPRFEGRIVPATFARKAAKFLARDGIVLYDNPDAFLICAFKHENALCEPDTGATAPRQYACQSGCGNTVRTDTHAGQMREMADEIDRKSTAVPEKLAKRMRRNADNFRKMADAHDATAQSVEALI